MRERKKWKEMPRTWMGGLDKFRCPFSPPEHTGLKQSPPKPSKTRRWASKCLQQREKGEPRGMPCHPILRLTIETHYQDSVAQTEGHTERTVEQTDVQTHKHTPTSKVRDFFPVCRNLWPRAHQASALPLSHTLMLTKVQRSRKERQRLLQALGSLQAKGNGKS